MTSLISVNSVSGGSSVNNINSVNSENSVNSSNSVNSGNSVNGVQAVYSAVIPPSLMVFYHFKYVWLGTGCHPQKPENRDEQSDESWREEGKEKYQLRGDFAGCALKISPQVKSTGDYGRHRQAEKEGKKHWSRREVKIHQNTTFVSNETIFVIPSLALHDIF